MPTRRSVVRTALLFSAGTATPSVLGVSLFGPWLRALGQEKNSTPVALQPGAPASHLPANFIGLGYEMASVAEAGLLDARNTQYVQLVRNLGPQGVLRLGGIVSDYTRYEAHGVARAEPKDTVITQSSLVQLRGFLDATGWMALWSLNFGRGTVEEAIVEARDVQRILGPRLVAVELGNEVDNYGRGSSPLRSPPYDFPRYLAEYREWHGRLSAAVPGLRFAAPDTAGSIDWVEQMATQAPGEVQLLTTHYYRGDQHKGDLDQLTHPDPVLEERLRKLANLSRQSGIPWRMCETNSFFGGGRPGLSDTFAGALWTLNYFLVLAQAGCAGVNLETGMNQLGFMSSYSPIKADGAGHVEAGAPYYGMLAFAAAASGADEIFAMKLGSSATDLVAFGLGRKAHLQSVVLLNWSKDDERRVSLEARGLESAAVLLLSAPSLSSTDGVSLGGAQVDASGQWKAATAATLTGGTVVIPPATAAIVRG